ncbi:MAG: hypothetical protein P0S96_08435 [Simkaniaceae bacterium]|nr:hypothetical protein [Candidatus Sacchlamyda saccharinae]
MQFKVLKKYNQRGWIPGPEEEKKPFEARIEALDHFFSYPPEGIDRFLTDRDWTNASAITQRLYDFTPDWIVAHYSNRRLSFFQGAATWITEKKNLRIPLIQLREKFETGKLLGLYRRDEVLAHEAVHAARMQFDEPFFEEIFAYRTSPRFLTRVFGPLFQRTWEAYTFILLLLLPIGIEIATFLQYDLGPWIHLRCLPLLFFGCLTLRLVFLRSILVLALGKLTKYIADPKKKWAVAFRLRDKEIFTFALKSEAKISDFLKSQETLRWDFLSENYFK